VNAKRPSFGEALRRARLRKKLTQQALAEQIGVSNATHISKWERNIVAPSFHYQQKLREVLGDFFDEGTDPPKRLKMTIWKVITPIQIIQLDDLSPEERE